MPNQCPNPSGLCMCGCGEPTVIAQRSNSGKGWVRGCPVRFVAGHHRRSSPHEYLIQDCGYKTPCWVWQRGKTKLGYGKIGSQRVTGSRLAYRHFYERERGPVPSGYELDHLCRNPSCVRPDHLEAVTHAENVRRGSVAKLTRETVAEILVLAESMSTKEIAERFGVGRSTVGNILSGHRWNKP